MSMVHVQIHGACLSPCCMSMSVLHAHVYVHAACPCLCKFCMSMPLLHDHVCVKAAYQCPCSCCIFTVHGGIFHFVSFFVLWRACNLSVFTHSSTGPVVHPFASCHEGPGLNPQWGTYVKPGFMSWTVTRPLYWQCDNPTWSHTALLSQFHARCRSSFRLHNQHSQLQGEPCGEPAISPRSHTVLMWNWDSPVLLLALSRYSILHFLLHVNSAVLLNAKRCRKTLYFQLNVKYLLLLCIFLLQSKTIGEPYYKDQSPRPAWRTKVVTMPSLIPTKWSTDARNLWGQCCRLSRLGEVPKPPTAPSSVFLFCLIFVYMELYLQEGFFLSTFYRILRWVILCSVWFFVHFFYVSVILHSFILLSVTSGHLLLSVILRPVIFYMVPWRLRHPPVGHCGTPTHTIQHCNDSPHKCFHIDSIRPHRDRTVRPHPNHSVRPFRSGSKRWLWQSDPRTIRPILCFAGRVRGQFGRRHTDGAVKKRHCTTRENFTHAWGQLGASLT